MSSSAVSAAQDDSPGPRATTRLSQEMVASRPADPAADNLDTSNISQQRDETGLRGMDRNEVALQMRICRIIRRMLVFTPLFLVFIVAVASAILNWQRHNKNNKSGQWSRASCLVVARRAVPDPWRETVVTAADNAWRPEVIVRDYSAKIDSDREVTAFFGVDTGYRLSNASVWALLTGTAISKFQRWQPAFRCSRSLA
jgi:hypothetical protein